MIPVGDNLKNKPKAPFRLFFNTPPPTVITTLLIKTIIFHTVNHTDSSFYFVHSIIFTLKCVICRRCYRYIPDFFQIIRPLNGIFKTSGIRNKWYIFSSFEKHIFIQSYTMKIICVQFIVIILRAYYTKINSVLSLMYYDNNNIVYQLIIIDHFKFIEFVVG